MFDNRIYKARVSVFFVQRFKLFALFEVCGFEVMPCSRCLERGTRCVRFEDRKSKIKKCGEGVKAAMRCDGSGPAFSSGTLLFSSTVSFSLFC